ncbi:MAG: glycosyltransferase family 2 protein [Burkholderiales bacterium]
MDSAARPEVTVVIGVRNGAATLQRCLDSIAAQDYGARETVVVDGASDDGTVELIERNAREGKIDDWISEPDGGVYSAWNKAIRRSRGRWLSFLGCDDAFHDASSLRALVEAAEAGDGRARVVYGRIHRVAAGGTLVETIGEPWQAARSAFFRGANIPHPGTLHRRDLLEQRGLFDESYRIAADYHLLLGEFLERDPAFVDRVVLDMGFGGMSSRPGNILTSLREVARARRAHGLRGTPLWLQGRIAAATFGAFVYRLLGDAAYRRLADRYRALRGRPPIWTVQP